MSKLTMVDFPTPEEPSNAMERPGARNAKMASSLSSVRVLAATTGAPAATASASARQAARSGQISALFNTTTGDAPLSAAKVR